MIELVEDNRNLLKLGILLDSFELPAWKYDSVERIIQSGDAKIDVILLNTNSPGLLEGGSGLLKKFHNLDGRVYKIFNLIDEKVFVREPNAFKLKDLRKLFSTVSYLPISLDCDETFDIFNSKYDQFLSDLKLDVLIYLGSRQPHGDMSHAAKYGVWYYEHNDHKIYRGSPPAFWEVVEKAPVTGTVLLSMGGDQIEKRILYRSTFLTYPFSPARNKNIQYWASSAVLSRQISLLARSGEVNFQKKISKFNREFDFYDHKRRRIPSIGNSLKWYSNLFSRQIVELYERYFRLETWFLMYQFSPGNSLSFEEFHQLMPPKDRFWADPHVVEKNGNYYIFVEEFFYKNGKGHISMIEMNSKGQWKDPIPVLVTDYHLSYPFIFENDGVYYMVPETAQNGSIDLYECVNFPLQWKYKMTLMNNVKAVDTTLIQKDGKWWMFTGLTENEGAFPEVELFVFFADQVCTTEWHAHPLNPVVSDATSARPAGKFFVQDGKLYRPSQNCSGVYGYGFNINEVLCLTDEDYFEEKVVSVKPDWHPRLICTHTFTTTGSIVIIDGLIRRGK